MFILSIVGLHGKPLVACAIVFCLEKESRTISSAAFDAKNNCYKYWNVRYLTLLKRIVIQRAGVAELVRQQV
jgi:hypothetical protein